MAPGLRSIDIVGLTAVFLLTLTPAPVSAGDPATIKQRAIELQRRADRHYQRGNLSEALLAAQAAYNIFPTPRTAFNVAVIEAELGQDSAAFDHGIEALNLYPTSSEQGPIEELLAEMGRSLAPPRGWIWIATAPSDAVIVVDAKPHPTTTPCAMGLGEGTHTLLLGRAGHRTEECRVSIEAGESESLFVALAPEPDAPAPRSTSLPTSATPTATATAPSEPREKPAAGPGTATGSHTEADISVDPRLPVGLGMGVVGTAVTALCGVGMIYFENTAANPSQSLERRLSARTLGLWSLSGVVLGLGTTAVGAVLAALALLDRDEPDPSSPPAAPASPG